MEKFDWTETIKLNTFILKIVGVWPEGDGSYKLNFYTFYAIITILLFVYGHSIAQTLNIFVVIDDLDAVTGTLVISMTLSLSILKSYSLISNMKTLKQLMVIVNSDSFQPKSPNQRELVEINLKEWKRLYLLFLVMTLNTILLWITFPFLDKTFKEYRLPFFAWYPFDTRVSPYYEVTYAHQSFSLLFNAMLNINTDSLIAALNMYVGAQIDILCDDLRSLNNKDESFNEKLVKCIKHHKQILKFAEDSNNFYNWIVFVQFFTSAISIAISLFKLTVVIPFSNEFYSISIYGMAVTVETFLYCWFGNEVEIKSKNIPYAAFESDWTGASIEGKKNMLFFVVKSQTPIKLSALNLFYLTLENFIKILRTSYSYFAVLHQVNSRN